MNKPNSNTSRAEDASEGRDTVTPEDLFRLHARAVFAVCLANTHNHHDAEDVTQSVFLKATAKLSGLRDSARARGWLLQVARRQCIDFHRRRKPVEPLLDEPMDSSPDDHPMSQRLHAAIQRLPESYREAIVLYYLDGRKSSSVAASLGIAEAAVRQRIVRARAMLHELLEGDRS